MPKTLIAEQRKQRIASLLRSAEGRKLLAAEMNAPLKKFRDYEAVGRRAFVVDPLAKGELPYYDKDVDTNALVIAEDGESVKQILTGVDRVFVPTFEIATLVEIPYTELQQRRYDLEARVKQRTRQDIFLAEDKRIFGMMQKAVEANNATNPVMPVPSNAITLDHISDLFSLVERHGGNKVTNIFINGAQQTTLRKTLKDLFEPVTVSEIVQAGVVGIIMGAKVNVSRAVPANYIFVTAEPEYTGRLVEAISLTSINADNPANRTIGFSVFESIGIFLQDHAVAAIKLQ